MTKRQGCTTHKCVNTIRSKAKRSKVEGGGERKEDESRGEDGPATNVRQLARERKLPRAAPSEANKIETNQTKKEGRRRKKKSRMRRSRRMRRRRRRRRRPTKKQNLHQGVRKKIK